MEAGFKNTSGIQTIISEMEGSLTKCLNICCQPCNNIFCAIQTTNSSPLLPLRMLLQPSPYILLAHHSDNPHSFLHPPLSIQSHDIPTHTPNVFPGSIEEVPPAIGWC